VEPKKLLLVADSALVTNANLTVVDTAGIRSVSPMRAIQLIG
jgi:hypothetical protein